MHGKGTEKNTRVEQSWESFGPVKTDIEISYVNMLYDNGRLLARDDDIDEDEDDTFYLKGKLNFPYGLRKDWKKGLEKIKRDKGFFGDSGDDSGSRYSDE